MQCASDRHPVSIIVMSKDSTRSSGAGDDGYVAYGSNDPEYLLRAITRAANRSDSMLEMYRECAPHLCEFIGSVAIRLYGVDNAKLVSPLDGNYFAPSVDPHLQDYLKRNAPTQTHEALHARLDANTNCVCWATVPGSTTALTVHGVNSVLWGVVALDGAIRAAFEFFRLDGQDHEHATLRRIEAVLAETLPVVRRELRLTSSPSTRVAESAIAAGQTTALEHNVAEVFHDILNFTTAVNHATEFVSEMLRHSRGRDLADNTTSLLNRRDDIATYLALDPAGKMILPDLVEAAKSLAKERTATLEAVKTIADCTNDMKDIIEQTQNPGVVNRAAESVDLGKLCDLVLTLNSSAGRGIAIERRYGNHTVVRTNKTKLMRILNHLILNAQESIKEKSGSDGIIQITTAELRRDSARLIVRDNGVGITHPNLEQIFEFGFTTKEDGFGYGLHASATLIQELGGTIEARSNGVGEGAEFQITIPITKGEAS